MMRPWNTGLLCLLAFLAACDPVPPTEADGILGLRLSVDAEWTAVFVELTGEAQVHRRRWGRGDLIPPLYMDKIERGTYTLRVGACADHQVVAERTLTVEMPEGAHSVNVEMIPPTEPRPCGTWSNTFDPRTLLVIEDPTADVIEGSWRGDHIGEMRVDFQLQSDGTGTHFILDHEGEPLVRASVGHRMETDVRVMGVPHSELDPASWTPDEYAAISALVPITAYSGWKLVGPHHKHHRIALYAALVHLGPMLPDAMLIQAQPPKTLGAGCALLPCAVLTDEAGFGCRVPGGPLLPMMALLDGVGHECRVDMGASTYPEPLSPMATQTQALTAGEVDDDAACYGACGSSCGGKCTEMTVFCDPTDINNPNDPEPTRTPIRVCYEIDFFHVGERNPRDDFDQAGWSHCAESEDRVPVGVVRACTSADCCFKHDECNRNDPGIFGRLDGDLGNYAAAAGEAAVDFYLDTAPSAFFACQLLGGYACGGDNAGITVNEGSGLRHDLSSLGNLSKKELKDLTWDAIMAWNGTPPGGWSIKWFSSDGRPLEMNGVDLEGLHREAGADATNTAVQFGECVWSRDAAGDLTPQALIASGGPNEQRSCLVHDCLHGANGGDGCPVVTSRAVKPLSPTGRVEEGPIQFEWQIAAESDAVAYELQIAFDRDFSQLVHPWPDPLHGLDLAYRTQPRPITANLANYGVEPGDVLFWKIRGAFPDSRLLRPSLSAPTDPRLRAAGDNITVCEVIEFVVNIATASGIADYFLSRLFDIFTPDTAIDQWIATHCPPAIWFYFDYGNWSETMEFQYGEAAELIRRQPQDSQPPSPDDNRIEEAICRSDCLPENIGPSPEEVACTENPCCSWLNDAAQHRPEQTVCGAERACLTRRCDGAGRCVSRDLCQGGRSCNAQSECAARCWSGSGLYCGTDSLGAFGDDVLLWCQNGVWEPREDPCEFGCFPNVPDEDAECQQPGACDPPELLLPPPNGEVDTSPMLAWTLPRCGQDVPASASCVQVHTSPDFPEACDAQCDCGQGPQAITFTARVDAPNEAIQLPPNALQACQTYHWRVRSGHDRAGGHWSNGTFTVPCPGEAICTGRESECLHCGTKRQICEGGNAWHWGVCEGQGECARGERDVCPDGTEVVCDGACRWPQCPVAACVGPNEVACDDCGGTQPRQCVNGEWAITGPCRPGGDCSPGDVQDCGQNNGTRVCANDCRWPAACDEAPPPGCNNNEQRELGCATCGTQTQRCENGAWVDLTACPAVADCGDPCDGDPCGNAPAPRCAGDAVIVTDRQCRAVNGQPECSDIDRAPQPCAARERCVGGACEPECPSGVCVPIVLDGCEDPFYDNACVNCAACQSNGQFVAHNAPGCAVNQQNLTCFERQDQRNFVAMFTRRAQSAWARWIFPRPLTGRFAIKIRVPSIAGLAAPQAESGCTWNLHTGAIFNLKQGDVNADQSAPISFRDHLGEEVTLFSGDFVNIDGVSVANTWANQPANTCGFVLLDALIIEPLR